MKFLGWLSRFLTKWGWDWWLGFALLVGILFLFVFAAAQEKFWQSAAVCLLIAGAASASGILIGFLFGIPRSQQRDAAGQQAAAPAPADPGVNTNLTEISDWLTKIIVGVGLVELTTIPGHLVSMADYLGTAFGAANPVPSAVVNLIMAYFAIFSFLLGYLWTRLYLAGEFSRAERAARERPEFQEGIVHALLYQPKPEGYTEAIEKALDYLKRFGKSNSRIWTYLACAYGQQYSYQERDVPPDQAKLDEIKKKALEAVKEASRLSSAAKHLLFCLWDPDLAKSDENDLVVFAGDKEFQEFFKDT